MDVTALVGVLGALGGVVLGSLLSSRSQMRMQREARAHALIDAKRTAYVEYLSTLRQFRRFILHLDPQRISVVEGSGSPRGAIPIIDGADSYWDAVERARSQLWIAAGYNSAVREASDKVMDAIYVIAREQATHPIGALPATVIDISRHAEQDFARVAHQDLTRVNSQSDR
jgi:hypothetical protein